MAQGARAMPDKLTSALLAALNESAEIRESDWQQIEKALRGQLDRANRKPDIKPATDPENRFATTICLGMAKGRSNF